MPATAVSSAPDSRAPGFRPIASAVLALVLAALLTPLVLLPHWLPGASSYAVGEPAPLSVRVSPLTPTDITRPGSAVAIVRGQTVTASQKVFADRRRQPALGVWLLAAVLLGAAALSWSQVLGRQARCNRFRLHLADGSIILLLTAASAALLLLSQVALFALPLGVVTFLSAHRNTRACALAGGAFSAVLVGAMVPGALGLLPLLAVQALIPALIVRRRASLLRRVAAAALTSVAAIAMYALLYLASWNALPTSATAGLASWLAAGLGPLVALATALLIAPLYTWMSGDVSTRTLNRLEKLSQPILRDLAQKAPGSWQHSLAMAKLAEAAGQSIDADTQLLRVGAYYHDLGKVAQPRYFIENLAGTEKSVHENVTATDSRNGIFEHITTGLQLGRDAGVPERILDFVRTHHGQGLLEYFWTKEQMQDSSGRGETAREADFRYPGSIPNSPETGILCICDAIEGATRPLKNPSAHDLRDLVHHIIFGKVRVGQLVHSGLSLSDLQAIEGALCAALQAAHAPAQKRSRDNGEISTAPGSPRARPARADRPSMAGLAAIRLDSHDRPSSTWKSVSSPAAQDDARDGDDVGFAATESLDDAGHVDTQLQVSDSSDAVATEPLTPEAEDRPTTQFDSQKSSESPTETSDDGEGDAEAASVPESTLAATRGLRRPSDAHKVASAEAEPVAKPAAVDPDPESEAASPEPDPEPDLEPEPEPEPEPEAARATPQPAPAAPKAAEQPLLLTSLKRSGPPSPPPSSRRFTIPLGKDEALIEPARSNPGLGKSARRADSQDGLRPGEMVIGAPPATHPERGLDTEERTALRAIPVPDEARRPEDRITEEQLALVPPASWGDPTAPSDVELTEPQTKRPGPKKTD